jgi:hypothetical protein
MFNWKMYDWNAMYTWFSLITTALMVFSWVVVRVIRRWQRRCKECGSFRVKRRHQLCPGTNPHSNELNFHSYTFSDCTCCSVAKLVKSEDKDFLWIEWYWRGTFFPDQFRIDCDLFRRAGLDVPRGRTLLLEKHHAPQVVTSVFFGK